MTHIDVMTIQDLWKENIDGYFPYLLDIYNPDIKWSAEEISQYGQENAHLRVICDDIPVRFQNKMYLPVAFDFTPPSSDGTKIGQASLAITSLDYRIRRMLRLIKVPSEVTVMAFYVKVTNETEQSEGTDDSHPVYKFRRLDGMKFSMESAESDKATVKFNLVFDRSMSQNVPYDLATQDRVPAAKG